MPNALIIFAKSPVPGRVKTRLTPCLSNLEAAALYEAMLLDVLEKARQLPGVVPYLFYQEEPGARDYFQRTAVGMVLAPQEGSDLGERMEGAFANVFAAGCIRVAIIGTDSPDLPSSFIEEAFGRLANTAEVVFGPSEDGGYYLLAMSRLQRELFRDIPWSSGEVLAKSLERAEAAGLRAELLPAWYDIDTPADLQRPGLVAEESDAVRTREFIRSRLR